MREPELSVIVTVVEGEPALSRCLAALARQERAPAMEVIVPFDASVAGAVASLTEFYPKVRFLALGALIATPRPRDAFEEHELFDRRRAEGLKAARGRLVAILEDRGAPRPDWARAMIDAHAASAAAAIGGGMTNAATTAMGRALFACDFGRYQPPFPEGEVEYASDINICYTREALDSVRELWSERYQETLVNWALHDKGRRLLLSSRPMVVHTRGPAPLAAVLGERMHWGRVFAIQRGGGWSPGRSLLAAAATVALPALLFIRYLRQMHAKGARFGEVADVVPAFLLILPAWSLGEALGYLDAAFGSQRARV